MAEALGHWIGQVIQAVEPWISTETDKGARWREEIGEHLEEARVGIVCLTPENIDERWIHFEAGALSKTKDAKVCTFLLGMQPADIKEPLAQFQATRAEKKEIRELILNINKYVGQDGGRALPEKDIDEIFEVHWLRLEEKLKVISDKKVSEGPVRKDSEKLDEMLEILRSKERRQQEFTVISSPGVYPSSEEATNIIASAAGETWFTVPSSGANVVRTVVGSARVIPRTLSDRICFTVEPPKKMKETPTAKGEKDEAKTEE